MRVLLADDHALFRAGLASLLSAWGLQVVGQAGNGEEAIALARSLQPDAIFMDINMPRVNGLEATRAVKFQFPEVKVIILTVSDDQEDLFEAVKAGAEGYLLKSMREEEFARLVERLARGEVVMSPGLAAKLLREFARLGGDPVRTGQERDSLGAEEASLTERERQVLEQVAQGATNKEVASALYISENTATYHMKNILSKLHLRNRAQVVAWAVGHGFSPKGPSATSP